MKKKKVYILFSGGLDSTYLVWKNLKDGNTVKPIYIDLLNNSDKSKIEKQQTNVLYYEFKKEFGKLIEPIDIVASVSIQKSWGVSFPQPFLWTTLIPFINSSSYDEIQIGYVINDDAISFLSEIKKLYKASQPFLHEKLIPLKFPIIKEYKGTIIRELPIQYVKYITSCEAPNIKNFSMRINGMKCMFFSPCKHCVSCKKIINSNYFNSEIIEKKYEIYKDENLITNSLLTLKEYTNKIEIDLA